jgi:hypothetical protein
MSGILKSSGDTQESGFRDCQIVCIFFEGLFLRFNVPGSNETPIEDIENENSTLRSVLILRCRRYEYY